MYNPYDINNEQDAAEARIERRRMKRDGYICRPISKPHPPTAGTAASADARGSQPHPAAGDSLNNQPHEQP